MFLCAYTSDDSYDYPFVVVEKPKAKKRQKKFKPTPEQTKAFEKLAKLKEKFPSYSKPRRLSEDDSYMLRMADMDIDCSFDAYCDMFGDINGNECTMDEW